MSIKDDATRTPSVSMGRTIYEQVRARIVDGRLPRGERLPPEETLTKEFQVARHTLRSALQDLEREGWIQTMGRRGGRIVSKARRNPDSLVSSSVLVITSRPSELAPADQRRTGWEKFIHVGVIEQLQSAGMALLTLQPSHLSRSTLEKMVTDTPGGAIILPQLEQVAECSELHRVLSAQSVPVCMYADVVDPASTGADTCSSDHAAGAYALTQWLIANGRQRILRFWETETARPYWLHRRDAGHEQAMHEHNLPVLPPIGKLGVVQESGFEARFRANVRLAAGYLVERLNGAEKIDAIMAPSDGHVTTLAAALRLLGKEPNVDVALVGYDNYFAEVPERKFELTKPAATVDKRNPELGHALGRLLLERLAGTLPPEPQHRVIAPELLVPAATPSEL